jgi:DMSO/TMAO reductase YedYZ heme-binding membrane subunit
MLARKQQWAMTATIFIVAFAYAILRYNILKGVAWEHLPLLISNKAISLSAVMFIALSYLLGPLARFWPKTIVPLLGLRQFFGLLGFGLAAIHGFASLLLFTPVNYPKFFSPDGTLNLIGELSMMFGILAFFIFAAVALTSILGVFGSMSSQHWQPVQRLGYFGLVLVLFHVLVMGYEGWMKPSSWPGGMLPISLMAAIVIAFALLMRIVVLISPGKDYQTKRWL